MKPLWPDEQSKERYLRFLQLTMLLEKKANEGAADPVLLEEMDTLLKEHYPRTLEYIERRLEEGPAGPAGDMVRSIAWAEARSVSDGGRKARVPGEWTAGEIAADIDECLKEAVRRLEA